MAYDEDQFLALSGIQHFVFCKRQWGLIHIEQAWQENALTVLGDQMHRRAHDAEERERRGNVMLSNASVLILAAAFMEKRASGR